MPLAHDAPDITTIKKALKSAFFSECISA